MEEVKDLEEQITQMCRVRYGQLEVNFPTQLDGEKTSRLTQPMNAQHLCPLLYAANQQFSTLGIQIGNSSQRRARQRVDTEVVINSLFS